MFTPSRFVVVDDKPAHLQAIMQVFQEIGAPCMGIVYNPEQALDPKHFMGVRALFLDLHLIEGAATTDHNRHFANLAAILEDNINIGGGPYVLIIWTEHAHLAPELTRYLEDRLDPARPHARPLAVLSLPKEKFINVASGAVRAADSLKTAVEEAISSNVQLAALLSWEADVLNAAGLTLANIMNMVPFDQRKTENYSSALDVVLSRMAREAVGRAHVGTDPRSAIASALAPILADRIINQVVTDEHASIWQKAVTKHDDQELGEATDIEAGRINRMLHVAVPDAEIVKAKDWGAVTLFPDAWWNDDKIQELFGVGKSELLGGEFKIAKTGRDLCRPRLIRVGAACDHAQNRKGPITYLFGLEIPLSVERKKDQSGHVRPPASEWISPRILINEHDGPFIIAVNSRYPVVLPPVECDKLGVLYRLREQLLGSLINHASQYSVRPGIVRL